MNPIYPGVAAAAIARESENLGGAQCDHPALHEEESRRAVRVRRGPCGGALVADRDYRIEAEDGSGAGGAEIVVSMDMDRSSGRGGADRSGAGCENAAE